MLKMLIVEDERWEREGLLDFLDWKEMGIEIAGAACDGIEGLEMALAIQPDIIVTDISMPGMNGIEMSKRIREQLPLVRIVVLTGYDDFGYAREAIHFRADDYVLKPVEEEDMRRTLLKTVQECEKEQQIRSAQDHLHIQLQAHERIAVDNLLSDLLMGRPKPELLKHAWNEFSVSSQVEAYVVCVWRAKHACTLEQINQVLNRSCMVQFGESFDGETAIIVPLQAGEAGSRIAEVLWQAAPETCRSEWLIGVGGDVSTLVQVHESYKQAQEAIHFGIFLGGSGSGIVSYREEEQAKRNFTVHAPGFMKKWQDISKQIRFRVLSFDEKGMNELLDELFQEIVSHRGAGKAYIGTLFNSMISELSHLVDSKNEDIAMLENDQPHDLLVCENLQDMRVYVQGFLISLMSRLSVKRTHKDEYVIEKVIELVETNYRSSEISLTMIAGEVFLSPNHLGMIFKKAMGKTLHGYLMEYRMNKAEELLRTTTHKVSWVAKEVGIPGTSYFCTLFKQSHGMTPREYQEFMLRR
jgi:two-component system response regulator YesN